MAISRCRISKKDQLRLVELFVAQATARTAADLVGIHRNSAALYFHKLRQCIAAQMAEVEPEMAVFECDESYFGGARKGKRGRGAAGKVCVFGILKRDGKVYALPIADTRSQTLLTALKNQGFGPFGGLHRSPGQLQHPGCVWLQASPSESSA